ncbi:MAG: right-handed parallel beta-helix repeat-containing protein [Betaproteobacteria bacterium]|nr:right-handed parallel beta-helix repeat-containing protein [Betaproteobacteria bacterium]
MKDVVINTPDVGCCFGVIAQNADRVVLDNVTVTSYQGALFFIDVNDALVMNSTVTGTGVANAAGLAVIGGSGNRFLYNTFGQPKTGATYSFNGGGLVFYNTSDNRFEGNLVQGAKDDAVDFTVLDSPNGQPTVPALNNYVGKNTVIHTALSEGRVLGASGIWSNCSSNGTWIYGNTVTGTAECGVCVWLGKSNMVLGNTFTNNGIVGTFVSGGTETLGNCTAGGGAFRVKPTSTFVLSNANTFNVNDQMVVRNADNTYVARNFSSPRANFGGATQACLDNATCQAAYSIETDGTSPTYAPPASGNNSGTSIVNNTSVDNKRGIWTQGATPVALEFGGNRTINSTFSLLSTASTINIDRGATLGGNFWSQFAGNGNPGTAAYTGVLDSGASTTGRVVDRFAFQSENLGRGYGATAVAEPRAGALVARGTKRTVRWDAPGCVWIDFDLDGTTSLLAGAPNTGYAIVTIPAGTAVGSHNIRLTCRDAAGTSRGSFNTSTFTVTDGTLKLLSPGRDDTFNASQSLWVSWSNTNNANASVAIDYSTDGGANWSNLSTVSSISGTNPVTSTRVTLPATVANRAMMRVRTGGSTGAPGTISDETDGWFAVRGGSGALTNVSGVLIVPMGQVYRLEWTSPANSRYVTLTATVGGSQQVIADIPDRGHFDWIPKDLGPGALTLALQFKSASGANIGGPVTNGSAGNTRYPTNITLGAVPSIAPGGTGTLTGTTNSGAAVTLTSGTPTICTVSGTTITGVANGTCTITANAAATGNFAAAAPYAVTFNVTAAANVPRLGNISTRMQVLTGDDVMIGGLIIGGTQPKTVVVRAAGPSLVPFGITNALANPVLTLVSGVNVIASNDNWQTDASAAALQASGFAPNHPSEAAVYRTLAPGAYTGIVTGAGGGTGVGIIEVFEVDAPQTPLINIATRGRVLTGNDVMIAGFVISGTAPQTVVVRARGPSLAAAGIATPLLNPSMQLFSGATGIATNDDWQGAANAGTLQGLGYAPSDSRESAILITLAPGAYTAVISGVGGTTGVAIVEVFGL